MIKSLQSLRGIFAFMIFLHHVPAFQAGGDMGVAFFFIVSGFLLARRYAGDIEADTFDRRMFVRRRVARVYPLHWLCLLLFFVFFAHFSLDNGRLVMLCNVLLLQSWVPSVNYYFSYYPLSWFLSDIVFCYALFPLLMRVVFGRSVPRMAMAVGGIFVVYMAVVTMLPGKAVLPVVYISPAMRWIDFLVGIVLCRLLHGRVPALRGNVAEFGAVALMVLFVCCYALVPGRYALASYWWLPSAVLVAVFAGSTDGVLTRLLSRRAFVAFGNISFYFYMAHGLVLQGYKDVAPALGLPMAHAVVIPVCFVLSMALAAGLERTLGYIMRRVEAGGAR